MTGGRDFGWNEEGQAGVTKQLIEMWTVEVSRKLRSLLGALLHSSCNYSAVTVR